MENDEKYEWISVSSFARRMGKTPQTVYNYIRDGRCECVSFTRGAYKGYLIKVKKEGNDIKND